MANDGQLRMSFDEDDAVGYRGPTVTKIVGITYRQLDYWDRTELVQPSVRGASGSGTQRLYSFDDVVALKVVKRLIDTGVSLQKIRTAIDELRLRGRGLAESTLVSDGVSVYAVEDGDALIDLLKKGQGVFAISVAPVIDELRGAVTAFPSERISDVVEVADTSGDAEVLRITG
ncbi:MAG: DNA-binding transcriptional MerR regulator [Myxococcota bacterium]|jgi:DNA-binding transcriptional MerR regulator